jgi:Tol biopolymer transport system component
VWRVVAAAVCSALLGAACHTSPEGPHPTPASTAPTPSRVAIQPAANGDIAYLQGPGAGSLLGLSAVHVGDARGKRTAVSPGGNLTDLAWSPDGTHIAYVDSGGEFGAGSIYVMNADGTDRRAFLNPTGGDRPISGVGWSADGRSIVYSQGIGMAASGDNRYRIFVKLVAGGDAIQLTKGPEEDLQPSWSPDGTQIAFLTLTLDPLGSSIEVMAADGTGVRQIAVAHKPDLADLSGPAWSPNGNWLVFVEDRLVHLVRPDASKERTIFTCAQTCNDRSPAWSPDGTEIALTVGRAGTTVIGITPKGQRMPIFGGGKQHDTCCLAWQRVLG